MSLLCDPGSKLDMLRWLETVALPAGAGVISEHQHLLRAMNVIDEYSDRLGNRLAVPAAHYSDFVDDLKKLHATQDSTQEWCDETQWNMSRLVATHDPVAAARRTTARSKTIAELLEMGQQCSAKLDEQVESQRVGKKKKSEGRQMSDSGTKARFYQAVKDAHMAHVIQVDLKVKLFSYSIDEDKKRYLELLDGKLLLVTNTSETAAQVVQRYKSLADIERGVRVLKSDIEIGPVYHPPATAHSRPCADLFHGASAVPGDAYAPEGRQTLGAC